jgi:hypothetical protein
VLRNADKPMTAGAIAEQLLAGKPAGASAASAREALHKTVSAALNRGRSKGFIERTGRGKGAAAIWRIAR